ncbi:MAG: hypothetical protein JXB13_10325 [Phycisphaerae bacterium]|nr:hypothetical protein [Phycisphaerae bacterium]
MTWAVATVLVLVFLGFAVLMFLERLSALLALPLMAVAFLLVSVGGDLLQPATVPTAVITETRDDYGRRVRSVEQQDRPSRFTQWLALRRLQHQLLHDRARLLQSSLDRLESAMDAPPDQLLQTLRDIHAEDERFVRDANAALAEYPTFFGRPGQSDVQAGRFRQAFDGILVSEAFKPIADLADSANSAIETQNILNRARADANRLTQRYPAPPETDTAAFRAAGTVEYLGYLLIYVLGGGSLRLHVAVIATVFGGMFAVYVKNLKVAERLVYWTAEFAGERPLLITLAVFLVTAGIFTSVGGLGTVIMLGTIILPILRSIGLSPIVGAGVFLLGISMGGTLNPVARRLWLEFYGIPAARLDTILWTMVAIYFACGLAWIAWGTRRGLLSSFCARPVEPDAPDRSVPARLMVAPLIPVALVYFAGIEEIPSFIASIVYMYLCICRRHGAVRLLSRSLIEGAQTVMPPALLMLGIGILITAIETAPVQGCLQPMLQHVVPESRWSYIAIFALAAPLALYRGPLNVWGMGLAVSGILLATSTLPPAAVLGAILAAGMLQAVCDPTNTYNVWIAGFQGVTVNQILRYTVLPVWAGAMVAIVIFGFWLVGAV